MSVWDKRKHNFLPTHGVIMWDPDGDFAIDFPVSGTAGSKKVLADSMLVICIFKFLL